MNERHHLKALVIFVAIVVAIRLALPHEILRRHNARLQAEFGVHKKPERFAATQAPELVGFLRQMVAAQEQYRLRARVYTTSIDSLGEWADQPDASTVSIVSSRGNGWAATVSLGGKSCSIWVRDSTLRTSQDQPEGHPLCGAPEFRFPFESVQSVLRSASVETRPFTARDVASTWLQHRADVYRTGISGDQEGGAYRWDAAIGGSIRSQVSIAGNQVFVGAHGNGEIVALTLDSGLVGFRIRAPNWVHHEPAVSTDLLLVGFGNSEHPRLTPVTGTDPSGVVAYDRLTGVERWRRYTTGSVMGTPVIKDSIVAVATGDSIAVGMRLRDGAELWRTRVGGVTPMANPLLLDTTIVYGVEKTSACSLNVHTGRLLYCRQLADCCWGAGHSSAAVSGDLILQLIGEIHSFDIDPVKRGSLSYYARKISGIPSTKGAPAAGVFIVAFDRNDGQVRWRVPLGRGRIMAGGHIAGTPTVVDGIAYLVSVYNGHIVAIESASGRLVWTAPVRSTRGSITVSGGFVFAATVDTGFVVLDRRTGSVVCGQRLSAPSDRAGLTISGKTGVLALRNGTILARPVDDWLACRA